MRRLACPLLLLSMLSLACGGSDAKFDDVPGDDGATDGTESETSADTFGTTTSDADASPTDTNLPPTDTPPPPPDTALDCGEPGAKMYNGHCYFRLEKTAGWPEQQKACAGFPGKVHLVTITSDGEQAFLQANFAPGTERWIGFTRDPASPPTARSSYKWITGEPATFDGWTPGEPNGDGMCARMRGDGRWADLSCTTFFSAICEREPS